MNINNLDQLTLFSGSTLEEEGIEAPIKKKVPKKPKKKIPQLKVLPKNSEIEQKKLHSLKRVENFLEGDSNQEAYSLAQEIIKSPGVNFPFVIFQGESGSGKTFLLETIYNEWCHNDPEKNYILLNGKDISQSHLPEIFKDFSLIDGIIIDDFIMCQSSPQFVELFPILFDNFVNKNRPIILSLDSTLTHLKNKMSDKFNNRINSALVKEIGLPGKELLLKFCHQKLKEMKFDLDNNSLEAINGIHWNNFFQINSFLQKLKWYQQFNNRKVNHLIILKLAGELNSKNSFSFYLNQISNYYNLSAVDLLSSSRKKEFVFPRQVLMYYLNQNLKRGVMEIGSNFRRDHTTILYGIKKIQKFLSEGNCIPFKQIFYTA